MHATMFLIEA